MELIAEAMINSIMNKRNIWTQPVRTWFIFEISTVLFWKRPKSSHATIYFPSEYMKGPMKILCAKNKSKVGIISFSQLGQVLQ